jgi:multidrug resistance efflux pump
MTPDEKPLFRQAALDHYLGSREEGAIVRVSPPWTWAVLATMAAMLLTALVLSVAGHVEVSARGRGILRPVGGVRALTAQDGGVVAEVFVSSGQLVAQGAPILRLESAESRVALTESERQLQLLESPFRSFTGQEQAFVDRQVSALRARIDSMGGQVASLEGSLLAAQKRLQAYEELRGSGLTSAIDLAEAREAVERGRRQLASSREALSQAEQEQAAVQAEWQGRRWRYRAETEAARTRRDALAQALHSGLIDAPEPGFVEAVLVRAKDVVQAGQQVGKLIPRGAPLQVISFLPEAHRASVKAGDAAQLELDQFPYPEFGTVPARVVRISDDLASPYEVREALGEGARADVPAFRVELAPAPTTGVSRILVRPGMLANVRFSLRRQRPIVLVLDPLRRWLD